MLISICRLEAEESLLYDWDDTQIDAVYQGVLHNCQLLQTSDFATAIGAIALPIVRSSTSTERCLRHTMLTLIVLYCIALYCIA
jgi:hypothetical protein